MTTAEEIKKRLRAKASAEKAEDLQWFFKTGPGEYGEGDRFLGVVVPDIRAAIKGTDGMQFAEIGELLDSPYHEDRMAGALILAAKAERGDKRAFGFYIDRLDRINNWDLVDLSAPRVVGGYLLTVGSGRKDAVLAKLSASPNMWRRRVAVLATFMFIKNGKYGESLKLARKLIKDGEDLMHKATGWMLREIGKRDKAVLVRFLERYAAVMPRTMLRYAIEKFSPKERRHFMGIKPNTLSLIRRG